jgi:hypothetical protein
VGLTIAGVATLNPFLIIAGASIPIFVISGKRFVENHMKWMGGQTENPLNDAVFFTSAVVAVPTGIALTMPSFIANEAKQFFDWSSQWNW